MECCCTQAVELSSQIEWAIAFLVVCGGIGLLSLIYEEHKKS
tara:strand:+ start:12011 stop:12136 length:126 start_codon:yes stop_codon:yes gene_type:complete